MASAVDLFANRWNLGTDHQYAVIDASTSGDTTVVSAVPGRSIRVIVMGFICDDAVVLTWKSSIAGAISGPESYGAHGGMQTPYIPPGIMQTAIGEALVLHSNASVDVGGKLTYILV